MKRSQRFPAGPRVCVWCGRTFTPPEKGKKAVYCQAPCRKRTMRVLVVARRIARLQAKKQTPLSWLRGVWERTR